MIRSFAVCLGTACITATIIVLYIYPFTSISLCSSLTAGKWYSHTTLLKSSGIKPQVGHTFISRVFMAIQSICCSQYEHTKGLGDPFLSTIICFLQLPHIKPSLSEMLTIIRNTKLIPSMKGSPAAGISEKGIGLNFDIFRISSFCYIRIYIELGSLPIYAQIASERFRALKQVVLKQLP